MQHGLKKRNQGAGFRAVLQRFGIHNMDPDGNMCCRRYPRQRKQGDDVAPLRTVQFLQGVDIAPIYQFPQGGFEETDTWRFSKPFSSDMQAVVPEDEEETLPLFLTFDRFMRGYDKHFDTPRIIGSQSPLIQRLPVAACEQFARKCMDQFDIIVRDVLEADTAEVRRRVDAMARDFPHIAEEQEWPSSS